MQARSGYNHESKGLKKEQMEELKYPFFLFFSPPQKPLLFIVPLHQKCL